MTVALQKAERAFYLVICCALACALGLLALPASLWIEARVVVPDFQAGSQPVVDYRRSIRWTFTGTFNAEIHRADGSPGQWCEGSGRRIYSASEPKRLPLRLVDYTGAAACDLPAGRYYLLTCWNWLVLFVGKTHCTRSNVFKVTSPSRRAG